MSNTEETNDFDPVVTQWVDALDAGNGFSGGSWRLQLISYYNRTTQKVEPVDDATPSEGTEGSGSDQSGETKENVTPVRIRRFCCGIPWSSIDQAVKYLHSKAPYDNIIFNGVKLDGKYVPTRTWWTRDGGSEVGARSPGEYTLFQDLISEDFADTFDFTTQQTCSEETSSKYVWDVYSVEDCPPGGQGVTNTVHAISRNEDGTFNYQVSSRKAITTEVPAYVTRLTKYEKETIQIWDNVYDGYGPDKTPCYVDGDGKKIDGIVFPSGEQDNSHTHPNGKQTLPHGELIDTTVQLNSDCTYRITVRKVESLEQTQTKEVRADLFETTVQQTTHSADTSIKDAEFPVTKPTESNPAVTVIEPGVVKQTRYTLRPDGHYDNTESTTTSRTITDAETRDSYTVFETVSTKTTRANTEPVALSSGTEVGSGTTYQFQNTKRPDGRYDTTTTTTKAEGDVEAEVRSSVTAFEVSAATTTRATAKAIEHAAVCSKCSRPTVDDAGKPTSEIGTPGTIEQVQSVKRPDGLYDTTVTVTTAVPDVVSETRQQSNFFEKTVSKSTRGVASSDEPAPDKCWICGGTIKLENIAPSLAKTHNGETPLAPKTTTGQSTQYQSITRPDGLYDTVVTTTTDNEVKYTHVSKQKGLMLSRVVIQHRNQTTPWVKLKAFTPSTDKNNPSTLTDYLECFGPATEDSWTDPGDAIPPGVALDIGEQIENRMTPNGRYDVTITLRDISSNVGFTSASSTSDAFSSNYSLSGNYNTWNDAISALGLSGINEPNGLEKPLELTTVEDGTIKTISIRRTEEGTYDVNVSFRKASDTLTWSHEVSTPWQYQYEVNFRNAWRDDSKNPPKGFKTVKTLIGDLAGILGSVSIVPNSPGNGTDVGNRATLRFRTESSSDRNLFANVAKNKLAQWFSGMVDSTFLTTVYRSPVQNVWKNPKTDKSAPPQSHSIDLSLSVNEYGLYDGRVVLTARWSENSPGQNHSLPTGVTTAYRIDYDYFLGGVGYESFINAWDGPAANFVEIYIKQRDQIASRLYQVSSVKTRYGSQQAVSDTIDYLTFGRVIRGKKANEILWTKVRPGTSMSFNPVTKEWNATIRIAGMEVFNIAGANNYDQAITNALLAAKPQ